MKVAAYQAPLHATGTAEVIGLIRERVNRCESEGVEILCCPEGVLGGLADYASRPADIAVDEKSSAPLHRQIYETICGSIPSGEFHVGRQLPAARLLARQLGVARMTVVNAYEQLMAEGYLTSRTGAGTFVAEHLPEEFSQAASFGRQQQPEGRPARGAPVGLRQTSGVRRPGHSVS